MISLLLFSWTDGDTKHRDFDVLYGILPYWLTSLVQLITGEEYCIKLQSVDV